MSLIKYLACVKTESKLGMLSSFAVKELTLSALSLPKLKVADGFVKTGVCLP